MSTAIKSSVGTFDLGDFRLQEGELLAQAQITYKTFGTLNAARDNVILYPTSYGATHSDIEWLIGPERIIDPTRYFIVIANMFGNGVSSSPSNLSPPVGARGLNRFTHVDNVTAQRRMLAEGLGIERLALVYGWSMGGQQALHWAALFPEQVERIAVVCSSAKTSPHNRVFLEGLQATLTTDPAWNGQFFAAKPEQGLRAFGRVYAGWALSQSFYRQHVYLQLGYETLEDFLIRDWEASFLKRDANNLISMIETWKRADISDNEHYQGDLPRALASVSARALIMPCATDLYFTPEDSYFESRQMPRARYLPIPSIWGHRAGNPSKSPADERFIAQAVKELLNS